MVFSEIPVNKTFVFEGEKFLKTEAGENFDPPRPEAGIAWSIMPSGAKLKEWAFLGDEMVIPTGDLF